jgi:F420-0:gamma-glutamyl ligase
MPPMRRGTVGVMIGYSGFCATNSLIGKSDLFGRDFQVSRQSVSGGLVAAANLVMGEGTEQTPIAIVYDVPFVKFQDRDPTPDEIAENFIPLEEDLYGPFLKLVPWQKGGGGIYDSSMIL